MFFRTARRISKTRPIPLKVVAEQLRLTTRQVIGKQLILQPEKNHVENRMKSQDTQQIVIIIIYILRWTKSCNVSVTTASRDQVLMLEEQVDRMNGSNKNYCLKIKKQASAYFRNGDSFKCEFQTFLLRENVSFKLIREIRL